MGASDFDPVASWQQFVSQWERQVNDLASQFSSREDFAGPLNQLVKLSMSARKTFDETAEKVAESMQLSTQHQMKQVIERLDRIEEQIQALAEALAPERGASAVARPAPKRTRRPPSESE